MSDLCPLINEIQIHPQSKCKVVSVLLDGWMRLRLDVDLTFVLLT